MSATHTPDALLAILRETIVGLVRRDGADLSARQMAVFLTCYQETTPQTVRGLASALEISKPAVTRALDRLAGFDLVARKPDPADRRSVLIARTPGGAAFARELRSLLRAAAAPRPAPRARAEAHATH